MAKYYENIEPLKESEFIKLKDLVYKNAGIFLKDSKIQMVNSRLYKRLLQLNMDSFEKYYNYLKNNDDGKELIEMINCITTNKTDFFRENHHFEYLRDIILPKLKEKCYLEGNLNIEVWCSASSTGEEPYTIAIVLKEFFQLNTGWKLKILASDIDTKVLGIAQQGIYNEQQISPIPNEILPKYFYKGEGENDGLYKAKNNIKDIIEYKKINLIDYSFPADKKFDIIFCRNVFIYFDKETMEDIVERFYRYLKPGGHLFLGHSETLDINGRFKNKFKLVSHTVFIKI